MGKMVKMSNKNKEKIKTALSLLCEDSTTLGKVEKVLALLPGIDPKTDKIISSSKEIIAKINQVGGGEVVELSLDKLPEKTKKQKKLKKLIILLLSNWKSLGSEVARINEVVSTTGTAATGVKTGKILATMKGPLGIVTIGAAAIVAGSKLLSNMAVEVKVSNIGCGPIGPFISKEVNIPGLKLPNKAIVEGQDGLITIPPIKMIANLNRGDSQISTMGFKQAFGLPSQYSEIIFDGQEMIGKETAVDLGSSKKHGLIIKCK
jgi:hypothetical protein